MRATLVTAAFPLFGVVINARDKTAKAACFAKIDAAKGAHCVRRAIGHVGINAKTVVDISREEFKRTAQIVGGLCANRP